jgi:hypothetical protein
MTPDEETDDGNTKAGKSHERVAKDPPTCHTGNHLAENAHAGQNHDIYGRMRVEPKQMLE